MKNYKILSMVIAIAMMMTVLFESMQVDASTLSTVDVSTAKIYDIALSNTGVIADSTTIDNVINQTINTIEGTAQSYKQWCEDNGKVRNATTWEEYLESDAYSTLAWRLSAWILRSTDIINYIITGESLTDELKDMIPSALTGLPAADIAKGFTLPSDVVEDIRNEFDGYIKDYGDYFYVQTIGPEQLNPLWFNNINDMTKVENFLKSMPYLGYMTPSTMNNGLYFSHGNDNTFTMYSVRYDVMTQECLLYSSHSNDNYEYIVTNVYTSDLTEIVYEKEYNDSIEKVPSTYEELINNQYTLNSRGEIALRKEGTVQYTQVPLGLISSDGRLVKVYRDLNALKLHAIGKDNYYMTSNSMDYSKNTDNSVKVTGDYLVDNSTVFSHDIIQETIDNSENITQETVNNIVNEGATTIINNYGSTSSGGGGNGGSDSGNNSILDGLGSIISALSDIVGFLLGVIGDVISLIGSLFTTVFEGLKSFVSIFSGFTGLLGEIFTFLPKELLDFLVLSIEAVIGIAIWKKFSK